MSGFQNHAITPLEIASVSLKPLMSGIQYYSSPTSLRA